MRRVIVEGVIRLDETRDEFLRQYCIPFGFTAPKGVVEEEFQRQRKSNKGKKYAKRGSNKRGSRRVGKKGS